MAGFDEWFARIVSGRAVSFVARAECGSICGAVTLSEIVFGAFRSAYVGYHRIEGFGGRGLMTAAVGQAVRFAFDELGLHRVEANIQPGNAASIALVKRLGFRLEGFSPRYLKINGAWRDHERWAKLADDADHAQSSSGPSSRDRDSPV